MQPVYEDNHIIIVAKESGEIVQGDRTGDEPLSEVVKRYLKAEHQKPGNVFLGVTHRLDRPVSGLVMFAKTSKALSRLNEMFKKGEVHKTYWAIVERVSIPPAPSVGRGGFRAMEAEPTDCPDGGWTLLVHWLLRNERQNKSYVCAPEAAGSKEARLRYRTLARGDRYDLLEVQLLTGRHHQIRCQLSAVGRPIRGDLKYGARRSNADGSISLLSRRMEFIHPVSRQLVSVESPLPGEPLWRALAAARAEK